MKYHVFLEVGTDGRAMAHVLQLPGCIAVAEARQEVLAAAPKAVRDYLEWLATHGERVAPDSVEIELGAESRGFGPFEPGDKAALFSPDREPLRQEEMAALFRWMEYSRDDLLAVIGGVPDQVLGEEYTQGWSIDTILRHIGGAEVWYVTRIDQEWGFEGYEEHRGSDTALEWLARTRTAAVARPARLTADERSLVFHPTAYTDHPDEAWTARKVFRRFLEHEGEHRGQIETLLRAHAA